MTSKYEALKKEVFELEKRGKELYISMIHQCHPIDEEDLAAFEKDGIRIISVSNNYQSWYTKACRVVDQIIPERLNEFVNLYQGDSKRKEVTYMNYSIYDYLIGLESTRGSTVVANRKSALPKMETQWHIISSASEKFESSLFDIKEILQADIFDTELDTAKELNKKGFVRAAGAVTGVVLEKHLAHICNLHKLKTRKAHPSISEYNQLLKDNDIIDTPNWRFIQRLGDIRNLCDHHKDKEPTKEDADELITGTEKIIKTIF
ncbi:hypothetical protein VRU76_003894 [Citrobacter freundii]|uniref:HEPN domain-containing protein n=1 Tax=Citrobacter pasteurii TaxID=1563222 RepID=A0A6N6K3R5_9ENTR|nr:MULTISPECIES: hypothetical protein [Citrobacter]EMD6909266.1 hypothetical protein [Citrobacter freundii]KAA1278129.1 hypothetical protein DXF85_10775 [Citrobacter pasteurii]MDM2940355.1 hypothetical protein [Citrobacter sp. Cy082]